MGIATQDGYIRHRSIHEKIILHQPSWSYAKSINQPSWCWNYQHVKSYPRWFYHTPINTRNDYHPSTLLIIRIKHIPTILELELSTWKELRKMVTSHTDQFMKRLSCINIHDHTHLAMSRELWAGKELYNMVTWHTDHYTKRLSCINLHDHMHQA